MTIAEMRAAAANAVVRAKALRTLIQAENRAATEVENVSFDTSMAEYDGHVANIAREERMATASAALAATRPDTPVLEDRGTGAHIHNNAEDKPWRSFGEYIRAVANAGIPGRSTDPRLLATRSASGMNESGAPDEGGFLVVSQYDTELIKLAHATGVMVGDCDLKSLTSGANSMTMFGVDETSRANGSRNGGVQSYWANEADTVTATKPKFRRMVMNLNKLFAICYATDEMIEDAGLLGAEIQQSFSEEMGFKLDDGIIRGTGAGQLSGVLNCPALITQAAEGGQASQTVVYNNILKMKNHMYVAGRSRAKWYVNIDVIPQLETMFLPTGSTGVAMIQPYQVNALGVATLFGREVVPIEQGSALGTVGDIIYADLSQFRILDKGGMQTAQSMHVRFLYGENTFRFVYRADGQSKWNSALTPYKGSTTVSPFVALAARP